MDKYYYRVYGLNVESEIKIDELEVIDDDSAIDLKITMGNRLKEVKKFKREKKDKQNLLITAKNVAHYYISNGKHILIEAQENACDEDIIAFLLGWAIGRILIQKNILALHAATVVVDGKGIILAGKSGSGKSTLTNRFTAEGHKFSSDEISSISFKENKPYVNPAYCLQKVTDLGLERSRYDKDRFFPIRSDRYAIQPKEDYVNNVVPLSVVVDINVGDNEELVFEKLKGSEKIEVFLKNIYGINTARRHGLDSEYFMDAMKIAKQIPVFRIVRPVDKDTVDEQMKLILANY